MCLLIVLPAHLHRTHHEVLQAKLGVFSGGLEAEEVVLEGGEDGFGLEDEFGKRDGVFLQVVVGHYPNPHPVVVLLVRRVKLPPQSPPKPLPQHLYIQDGSEALLHEGFLLPLVLQLARQLLFFVDIGEVIV